MSVSPALLEAAERDPLAAIDSVNAFSHSTMAGKPSYPGPGSWLHGANRALMRRVQARDPHVSVFVNDFRACDRYQGGIVAAAKVACPTTLILGTRDQMTLPGKSGDLARALHADVAMLPAGHALMSEAPDAVLDAIRTALAERVAA
jgi:pimeloyl-ACP methyl ester carboxylesterase